jgi:hypothetical protein
MYSKDLMFAMLSFLLGQLIGIHITEIILPRFAFMDPQC